MLMNNPFRMQIGNKEVLSFLRSEERCGGGARDSGCRKPRCLWNGCSGLPGCKRTWHKKTGHFKNAEEAGDHWTAECDPPAESEKPPTPPAEAGTDYSDKDPGL